VLRRYIIIINFFLIVLSILLIDGIYNIWTSKEHQQAAQGTEVPQDPFPEPKLKASVRLPKKAYQEIVDKDLFRPERTEWRAPVEEKEAATVMKTAPKLDVYGIVISGGFKYAWVKGQGTQEKSDKISEGQSIEEWRVSAITPYAVSLSRGKESVEYKLIELGKPKQRTIPKSLIPEKPAPQPGDPKSQGQPAKALQHRARRTALGRE